MFDSRHHVPGQAPPASGDRHYRHLNVFVRYGKRTFDFLVALMGLMFLSPLFLAIALLIKLDSPGPVFFRHLRVGHRRRPFGMWKFRKMHHHLPSPGSSLTQRYDSRLTSLGRFLERTKLDELPQLLNVLTGDMSIVGPRPEVPQFVAHYPKKWDVALSVKPGIVGPAQLRFRNESELYPDDCDDMEAFYVKNILPFKLSLDVDYVNKHSLTRDFITLVKSILVAILGSVTKQTLINRRWQIANFIVLWLLGIGGTVVVNRLTGQSLRAESTLLMILLAAVIKGFCLILFRIPKALASSMTADDFMRLSWCAATSGSMIICGMLFAECRDVARVALILDTIAFATVLVVYKLACYNYYVCFSLQKSRDLSRRLTIASLWIAPLSIGTVLTVRHGQRGWSEDLALSITLLLVAAVIRPMIMLFQPVSSRCDTTSWLLREWKKLFFASAIGSSLMVSAALLFNERGVARLDIVWDNAIYLLLTTGIALSHNKSYRARLLSHSSGMASEAKERLLIVGVGIELSAYISALSALPEQHFEVIGVVTPNRRERSNMVGGFPILGEIRDAPEIVKYSRITRVVVVGRRGDKATFQYLREKCALGKEQVLRVEILNPVLRRWRRDGAFVVPPRTPVTSRNQAP